MYSRISKSKNWHWMLGGMAGALLLASQALAQNAQNGAPLNNSNTQHNESSVLAPPTPPPTNQPGSNQGMNNQAMNNQPAGQTMNNQPANNLPPANQPMNNQPQQNGQAMQQQNLPAPPQPPEQGSSGQASRATGQAQLGVYVVPTNGAGVRIDSVTSGTAAATAGLKPGDVILAINGKNVGAPQDVINTVRSMNPGDNLELRVWRNGAEQTVTAQLQQMRPETVVEYSAPASTYIEGGVSQPYYSNSDGYYTGRYNGYYPGSYGRPYGYGYRYGRGWGSGAYYGTPGFGYSRSPWGGQGVRVGSFGFGWR